MVRKKRSNKKGKKAGNTDGPASTTLTYRGPVIPPRVQAQEQLVLKVLSLATVVSSNGSGIINNTFGLQNPSSFSGWANFAAIFDEYRVLATVIQWIPSNGYNKVIATQTCLTPLYVVLDRDSVTTIASTSQACGYDSVKAFDLERPFKYAKYKMSGSREATFITTASPTNLGAYALWSNNLTASLQYGTIFMQMLVQFRASA